MRAKERERQEAIASLRELLKPGDIVYTHVDHVSRSGMSRSIDVRIIRNNTPRWIARTVATAIDMGFDEKHQAVKMGGCGMDMGFALVYELSHILFPGGFECTGSAESNGFAHRCPSNDHSNGDRDYTPHHHSSGGYALRQQWM